MLQQSEAEATLKAWMATQSTEELGKLTEDLKAYRLIHPTPDEIRFQVARFIFEANRRESDMLDEIQQEVDALQAKVQRMSDTMSPAAHALHLLLNEREKEEMWRQFNPDLVDDTPTLENESQAPQEDTRVS